MHYLDHAATTPMRASAREAWLAATEAGGNPSAVHDAGRRARATVEDARERIAAALGARASEVTFTSGGTESDNLAVKGMWWARTAAGAGARVVTSAIEHHAALDAARWLGARQGADVVEVPVTPHGVVDLGELESALDAPTALVSVQWVNNETGVIQPVAAVVEAANAAPGGAVPVHSDAVQAVGHIPVHFAQSGLATMAVSAHKLGGPVGIGALLARRDIAIEPLAHGGAQDRRRSGTLDAAGAAAFAAAVEEAVAERDAEATRLAALRDRLVAGILGIDGARVSGLEAHRAPHIVHTIIPGAPSEALLFLLDTAGSEVSSGSACTAGVVDPSHVALAMGAAAADAECVLRVSLGWSSTDEDVEVFLGALPGAVERARASATRP